MHTVKNFSEGETQNWEACQYLCLCITFSTVWGRNLLVVVAWLSHDGFFGDCSLIARYLCTPW
jgi:hypothetical protein